MKKSFNLESMLILSVTSYEENQLYLYWNQQSFDLVNADPVRAELLSNYSTLSMLILSVTSYEEINEGLIDALVLRKYSFGN